ncbi:uncharacterized protein LOC130950316 [Arachis stenosperma]|uniref:uncharacterized protein LOC130950316 n=1 Tax=Arachis stenosperma TaxID=217475 RepID=UPI0025AD336B|nr:uncharacterized protein LOC130950316 [Arachis stenosperma]
MTTNTSTKTSLSMKLLIDTKGKKVLFAEASKEVVDFLFTFLQLPLAIVVKLLTKEDAVGCLGNLYSSVENLNHIYMQPNLSKDLLLRPTVLGPTSPSISGLLPSAAGMITPKLYGCNNSNCKTISDVYNSLCGTCTNYPYHNMTKETTYIKGRAYNNNNGFVKEAVSYMIMDDLVIKPISTISSITMLNNQFNGKNVAILKDAVVQLGMKEGLKILKTCMQESDMVLTSVFLDS